MVLFLNAKEYALVMSSSNPFSEISIDKIRALYLKKSRYIEKRRVVMLNFPASSTHRDIFMKRIMEMDLETWESYFNEMHFKGIDPPKVMRSSTAIKRFIDNVPNAIGYLPMDELDNRVLVLKQFISE
jgi:hypothetical protein